MFWSSTARRDALRQAKLRRRCLRLSLPGSAALFQLLSWAAFAEAPPIACATPAELGDGWQPADPVEAAVDAGALCEILRGIAAGPDNFHGVLIYRNGHLIAELYRRGHDRPINSLFGRQVDFGPNDRHDMRSISKSIVGLLFGILAAQGKLPSLSSSIFDFYPQYADLREPERNSITLETLLTMSSGLQWHEGIGSYGSLANDETRLYWDWAPVRFVLSRPIDAAPGVRFNYNGGGTAVIADLLVRACKTALRELARVNLFEPMGIRDWEWSGDLYGRPVAFAGLRLKPRDLLKIGRLMLDEGRWQGNQVVPADWVAQSTRSHFRRTASLATVTSGGRDWLRGKEKVPWGAAFGNGGQRLFLVPRLNLAVVMTAGAYNDAGIAIKEMELFRQIIAAVQR
jgi:CubicO group peptidase (beta-lactamase class C family)